MTLKDELTDLFGKPLVPSSGNARTKAARRLEVVRLRKMHTLHGDGPAGQTCGACEFLANQSIGRGYWKCLKYGVSSSEASDWRKKWAACGAFKDRASA